MLKFHFFLFFLDDKFNAQIAILGTGREMSYIEFDGEVADLNFQNAINGFISSC